MVAVRNPWMVLRMQPNNFCCLCSLTPRFCIACVAFLVTSTYDAKRNMRDVHTGMPDYMREYSYTAPLYPKAPGVGMHCFHDAKIFGISTTSFEYSTCISLSRYG